MLAELTATELDHLGVGYDFHMIKEVGAIRLTDWGTVLAFPNYFILNKWEGHTICKRTQIEWRESYVDVFNSIVTSVNNMLIFYQSNANDLDDNYDEQCDVRSMDY